MEDQEEVMKVALAGLLHDVGKLGTLAGERATGAYVHATVGERFVRGYVPPQWQDALAPVGWHHGEREEGKIKSPLEEMGLRVKLVALADRLSSGERETKEDDTPRTKQLLSPFGRVPDPNNLEKLKEPERSWLKKLWIPPRKLELDRVSIFPTATTADDIQSALGKLWDGFRQEAQALQKPYEKGVNITSYLESMFYLLRDFTWCVPSAYWHSEPDVSLFAHLHTTAALGACLAHSVHVDRTLSEDDVNRLLAAIKGEPWPEGPIVAGLLGVDLSGIQKFIYSLYNPEGAAASLRARSFYIQVLTEAIARWILEKLGLPITNAIYIGGGGFTLIVPPCACEKVEELRGEINDVLYRAHGISLYLGLGYMDLAPEDFRLQSEGLAKKREELGEKLDRDKAKRFSSFTKERLARLFEPEGFGGDASDTEAQTILCQVCGAEVPKDRIELIDEVRFCPSCLAFRELGRDLTRAQYLFLAQTVQRKLEGDGPFTWEEVLAAFGSRVAVLRSVRELPPERPATLFALDDGLELPPGPKLAVGRRFLVNLVSTVSGDEERKAVGQFMTEGQRVPGKGEPKHFGILARQSEGAPYLGILRMDMDNLGRIFSRGLGKYATLSRIATMSFLLSVFFEGWTEVIAKEVNKAHERNWERLYTVYSGGDDLFFVGSWDAVVELARGIRRDLQDFTGRDELGISGGITLVHEKYPLYLAAEDANGAEKAAKSLRKGKDAFSFLGIALPWKEFGYKEGKHTATSWAKRLTGLISEGRLPRGLLEQVQALYARYTSERKERGEYGPWVWHAAYWLSRMLDRTSKEDEEAREALQELREALSGLDFSRNIARLALAARWAELTTKGG